MSTSKAQRERRTVTCQCGCGEQFICFPVYRPKSEGGGLRYPEYKCGHHPNCRATQNVAGWNRGMKLGDHPSLERMVFKKGHAPHNDWSVVNQRLATDPDFKAKWRAAKKGKAPWNKGKTVDYIPSGPMHWNWKGGKRGIIDTAAWQKVRLAVYRRDNYTCQQCGDKNHEGRGSRIRLEAHHVVSVSDNHAIALDPSNIITLCASCHRKTDNFGSKGTKSRKK